MSTQARDYYTGKKVKTMKLKKSTPTQQAKFWRDNYYFIEKNTKKIIEQLSYSCRDFYFKLEQEKRYNKLLKSCIKTLKQRLKKWE